MKQTVLLRSTGSLNLKMVINWKTLRITYQVDDKDGLFHEYTTFDEAVWSYQVRGGIID